MYGVKISVEKRLLLETPVASYCDVPAVSLGGPRAEVWLFDGTVKSTQ